MRNGLKANTGTHFSGRSFPKAELRFRSVLVTFVVRYSVKSQCNLCTEIINEWHVSVNNKSEHVNITKLRIVQGEVRIVFQTCYCIILITLILVVCWQYRKNAFIPQIVGSLLQVFCDMETNGGGYTFINPLDLAVMTENELLAMYTEQQSVVLQVAMTDDTQHFGILQQLPAFTK